MLPKKKFRELVFQLLFSHDLGSAEEAIPLMSEEMKVSRSNMRAAHDKMKEVVGHIEELDLLIGEAAKEYEFARIQKVERNILRLGVFEILFDDSVPPKVAISEAVRLCKKFSTPESLKFVNAVLDAVYKSTDAYEVPLEEEDKSDIYFNHKDNQ